jgi:hypothetical protein
LVENHKTTNMHIALSRAFQHYQKQRVRSYDLERLQHDHIQTNKETCITCISIYRLCACFYVFDFVWFDNVGHHYTYAKQQKV